MCLRLHGGRSLSSLPIGARGSQLISIANRNLDELPVDRWCLFEVRERIGGGSGVVDTAAGLSRVVGGVGQGVRPVDGRGVRGEPGIRVQGLAAGAAARLHARDGLAAALPDLRHERVLEQVLLLLLVGGPRHVGSGGLRVCQVLRAAVGRLP